MAPPSSLSFLFGESDPASMGRSPGGALPAPNSEPLGSETGAPVRTVLRQVSLLPGVISQIVNAGRANRAVILYAPLVAFSVFVGDSGVNAGGGYIALPPGSSYEIVMPGFQELYAVTDAPVVLPLRVQIAPLLIGDTERRL